VAESVVTLRVDTSQATRALRGVQNESNTLTRAVGGLKTAIAGVGITVLAKQAVLTSANFQKLNVRLGLLTKASGTFARSQELATQAQKAFGLSATEALEGITDITARLQPLGVGVEDIKTTFFGFNTAAKLAGASAIESSNAFRQLAQALGSGRLQGDEFRSISEQIPTILKPVADELGTTVGELKKFSSEGKITSAVVIRALKKIENKGGKSLAELLKNDPTQVFKNLSNEAENLSRAFGDALAPAVLPVIRAFTEITKKITEFINSGAGKVSLIFTGIAVAIKGITVITPLLIGQLATMTTALQVNAANSILASTGLKGLAASSFLAAGGITKAAIALNIFKVALIKTGIGAAIVVLGTLAAKFIDNKNSAKEAAEAAKAFDNNLKGIVDTADNTEKALNNIAIANKEFELSNLGTNRNDAGRRKALERELEILKERAIILKGEKEREAQLSLNKAFNDQNISILKNITSLRAKLEGKEEELSQEEKIAALKEKFGEQDAQQIINLLKIEEGLKKQVEQMTEIEKEAERIKGIFTEIGNDIATGVSDALVDAINGTKTLGEAASGILRDIGNQLLRLGINTILKQFGGPFSNLVGFANGGRPPVNRPSIVGEKGPEIFVPSSAGKIIPNDQIGGGGIVNNINIAVDASGSNVEGDENQAAQLGKAISQAIQAELVQQKRQGGLLYT
jgi:tape measure domain-containing protein